MSWCPRSAVHLFSRSVNRLVIHPDFGLIRKSKKYDFQSGGGRVRKGKRKEKRKKRLRWDGRFRPSNGVYQDGSSTFVKLESLLKNRCGADEKE